MRALAGSWGFYLNSSEALGSHRDHSRPIEYKQNPPKKNVWGQVDLVVVSFFFLMTEK